MTKSNKVIAGLGVAAALGMAVMPFAGAFALDPTSATTDDSADVEVEIIIDSAIALSVDAAKVSTNMDTSDADETLSTAVTVSTNDVDGYTLTVIDADATNALTATGVTGGTIAAYTSPVSAPTAGTAGWGLKGGDVSQYTGVPVSTGTALTLKANGTAQAADEVTNVTYGVATAANQPTGTYSDTITYTAAVK